jgi:hypothetical protein
VEWRNLTLGSKGSSCTEFFELETYLRLFPDVVALHVAEPTSEFIEGVPRNISSLSLRLKEATEDVLEAVSKHSQLRELSISTSKMNPADFQRTVAVLDNLEHLELKGKGVGSDLLLGLELSLKRGLVLGPGNQVALFGLRGMKGSTVNSFEIHSDSLKEAMVRSVVADWKGGPTNLSIVPLKHRENLPPGLPQAMRSVLARQQRSDLEY